MHDRGTGAAMAEPPASLVIPDPPAGFAIERSLPSGRHEISKVFPGIDRLPTAKHLLPDDERRARLFAHTQVELVEDDIWMYVAPWEIPESRRGRWHPVLAPGADCIVIGMGHLKESPAYTLFLDIFHELRHVLQRQGGAQLFGWTESYVRRPTEVDAYQFVVNEARAMGVADEFLRDYLRVEWIDDAEFLELLSAVGVPPP
jgi:hypothetical protein